MNIYSMKILPAWRNKRTREDALARRLNRFMIKAPMLASLDRIRQWVGSGGIFNHSPIFMDIMNSNHKPNSPLKFNLTCLAKVEFHKLVMESWTHCGLDNSNSLAKVIACNLARIKLKTIRWAKEKKKKDESIIQRIESDIRE